MSKDLSGLRVSHKPTTPLPFCRGQWSAWRVALSKSDWDFSVSIWQLLFLLLPVLPETVPMRSSAKPSLGTLIDSVGTVSTQCAEQCEQLLIWFASPASSKEAILSLILTLLVIDFLVQWIFHTLGMLGRCAGSAFTSQYCIYYIVCYRYCMLHVMWTNGAFLVKHLVGACVQVVCRTKFGVWVWWLWSIVNT